MPITSLDDLELTQIDEYPADTSVKLHGPPGTGKTTQSIGRVATLIRDYDYDISDVAWCTYRKSLAAETLERLVEWDIIPESQLNDPSEGATRYINTTHAVANRVVGGVGDIAKFGHRKDFANSRNLRLSSNKPWDEPAGELLFKVFDYMANNLLDPHSYTDQNKVPMIDDLRDKWYGDLGSAWDEWQDYKAQRDLYDFHEQLAAPLESNIAPTCPILVVDEYHDATPLMAKLSEFWAEKAEIVIIAGDPNQVVNSYAGADPEFFNRVEYPEVLLDKTYRVPFEHWSVAERILSNAHTPPSVERNSRGPFSVKESPAFHYNDDRGWSVPAGDDEYSPVWFIENVGTDAMFLTRTQKQADGVACALEKAGVLFRTQNSMDRDGWEAPHDQELSERTAVYNALQKIQGFRRADFAGGGLADFADMQARNPASVTLSSREAAALIRHGKAKYLPETRDKMEDRASRLENEESDISVPDFDAYVDPEFWDIYTQGPGAVRHLVKGRNSYRLSNRDMDALKPALRRNDGPAENVETKVYTIHASKGSEAKNVVVYDGITGRIGDEMELKESARNNEWRTWYVALTRASEHMIVLRHGFDWTHSFLPESLLDMAQEGYEEAEKAGVAT